MTVYIIADLHLSPETPDIKLFFCEFCEGLESGDDLYILGDFFDYFIEPDPQNELHTELRQTITSLVARGVMVYFMHGNRDFLLTKSMAKYFGFTLVNDNVILQNGNSRILLMHGDELCTSNRKYTFFRRFSRNKLIQFFFFLFSTSKYRETLAKRMRENSRRNFVRNNCIREQINQDEAIRYMQKNTCNIMIHGHTHNVSKLNIENKTIYDTGDWRSNEFSYIEIRPDLPEPQIIRNSGNNKL